jgi:hypothetical protein
VRFAIQVEQRHSNIEDDSALASGDLDTVPADLVSSTVNGDFHD